MRDPRIMIRSALDKLRDPKRSFHSAMAALRDPGTPAGRAVAALRELGTRIPPVKPWALALGCTLVIGLGIWIFSQRSPATANPPLAPVPAPTPSETIVEAVVTPAANPPPIIPTTARIEFSTVPAVDASVTWGKTRLGRIAPRRPLVVVRPRDSGPLDVIVRAEGYLPVHTRAHTFADTKVLVKLTKPEQKNTLLGYRAPLDAGAPLAADAATTPTVASDAPPLQLMP
jgi:hypothetical protein